MKPLLRSVIPSLICVATLAACGSVNKSSAPTESKPIELHMATITLGNGPGSTFASEVARLSGGKVTIKIDTAQHRDKGRGGDPAILDDVIAGKADLGVVTIEALEAKGVTALDPLAAPGILTTIGAAASVAGGPLAVQLLAAVSAHSGAVGLAIVPGRIHYLVGTSEPVQSVADLVGQPVTLFGASNVGKESLEALGATVRLDDRTNKVTDAGRAVDTSAGDIQGRDMASVTHVIMGNVPLWPENLVIVMNKKAYDSLDSSSRELLAKAGLTQAAPHAAEVQAEEDGALTTECSNQLVQVAQMPDDQVAALRAKMSKVIDRMRADATLGPIVKSVEAQAGGFNMPKPLACVGAVPDTDAPTPLTGASAALVGTWTLDVTQAMWDKATTFSGEDGEIGHHTLVLSGDGYVHYIDAGNTDLKNVAHVEGDVLTIKVGGHCTQCGSGETWQYTWSVFGDQLTLKRHEGPGVSQFDGPTALVIAPFTKSK